MSIKIDKEFRDMIPPLSPAEFDLLESSILVEGCRDSLVVWDGTLIDGHNRHAICTKHGIEFQTVARDFVDRDEALNWIDSNQLGRRNATPDQMSLIRGRLYNRMKKQGVRSDLTLGQIDPKLPCSNLNTADLLSAKLGVSPSTIKRDGASAALIDQHPKEAQAIINGAKKKSEVLKEINPPVPKPDPPPLPDISEVDSAPESEMVTISKEQFDEMQEMIESSLAEEQALANMLDAQPDDQLAVATEQIKQLSEQVRILNCSLAGANNQCNELKRLLKARDRQIAKLEKENDKLRMEALPL